MAINRIGHYFFNFWLVTSDFAWYWRIDYLMDNWRIHRGIWRNAVDFGLATKKLEAERTTSSYLETVRELYDLAYGIFYLASDETKFVTGIVR